MSNVIFAVAKIMGGDDFGKLYGYRMAIIDKKLEHTRIVDISVEKLYHKMELGEVQVGNLGCEHGRIVGTQGEIERLPSIDKQGNFLKDNNATILYKVRDRGFVLLDWKGINSYFDLQKILQMLNARTISGLTNGKLVSRNGLYFISAIRGSFYEINV